MNNCSRARRESSTASRWRTRAAPSRQIAVLKWPELSEEGWQCIQQRSQRGRGAVPSSRMQRVSLGCRKAKCRRKLSRVVALPGQPSTGHCARLTNRGKLIRYCAGCLPGASALPYSGSLTTPCCTRVWLRKAPADSFSPQIPHSTRRRLWDLGDGPSPVNRRLYDSKDT